MMKILPSPISERGWHVLEIILDLHVEHALGPRASRLSKRPLRRALRLRPANAGTIADKPARQAELGSATPLGNLSPSFAICYWLFAKRCLSPFSLLSEQPRWIDAQSPTYRAGYGEATGD